MSRTSRGVASWSLLCLCLAVAAPAQEAIVVDHTCTDLDRIPAYWIQQARQLAIHYAHTSHGSQLMSGLEYLEGTDS